jgi:hypothetical protein
LVLAGYRELAIAPSPVHEVGDDVVGSGRQSRHIQLGPLPAARLPENTATEIVHYLDLAQLVLLGHFHPRPLGGGVGVEGEADDGLEVGGGGGKVGYEEKLAYLIS